MNILTKITFESLKNILIKRRVQTKIIVWLLYLCTDGNCMIHSLADEIVCSARPSN